MRIVALDAIRFIAALSVVFYHYIYRPDAPVFPAMSEVAKFGYLGVPLFFMISGLSQCHWFISPAYSSFFIGGIAFFMIQSHGKNTFNISIMLISLIISCFKAFQQTTSFIKTPDTEDTMIPVLIICLFYLYLYLLSTGRLALAENRLLVTVGALTYPLYLIHNHAGKAIIDYYSGNISEGILVLSVILSMLVVSWIMYTFVEKPLISSFKERLLKVFSPTASEQKT